MKRSRIKAICILILAGLLWGACSEGLPDRFQGRVTWVNDGDTLIVLHKGRKIRVRLYGIDAPEKEQPYARQSLKAAIRLAKGNTVTVERVDIDAYGRVVGWVTLPDGRMMNHEMVRAGLAWHFRRYSDSRELAQLEKEARKAGQGLWRDDHPEAPWEFRMRNRD